jgi:hypothetical protein
VSARNPNARTHQPGLPDYPPPPAAPPGPPMTSPQPEQPVEALEAAKVERMDRIARAGIALREALAASPAAPEPPYLCQHESCSEQTVEPAPPPPVVAALAWALAERSQDGPHGSNERRRFRPLARAFLSDLLRDPRRAAAVRDFLAARLTDPSR